MQIDVDMSYEEYWKANRAWLTRTTASRRWNFWFTWYINPVIGIVLIALGIVLYVSARQFSGAVLFNLIFGAFLLYCRFQYPRRVLKLYRDQAAHFAGMMTLEPSGLDYVRKDGAENSHHAWNAFELWTELPEAFLLFPNTCSFIRVPKQNMTRSEQDQLREWLVPIKLAE